MTLTPQNLHTISKHQQTWIRDFPHLLHKHDNLGANESTTISWDGDEFEQLVLPLEGQLIFGFEKCVHVEEIAGCLDPVEPKSDHGLIGFVMSALRHVPPW